MKEILVIVVLISGLIKGQLLFWGFPSYIDFTLISFLLLLLYSIINIKEFSFSVSKNKALVFLSIILFYIWIIFSLLYTSSKVYSYSKTFLFLTNIIPLCFLLFIKEFDHRKFIRYFVIIVFVLNIFGLFYDLLYISRKLGEFRQNYFQYLSGDHLVLGELTGLLMLVMITYTEKPVFSKKYLDPIMILIGILFLFILSARGPLVFFFFSLLIYIIIRSKMIVIKNIKFPKAFLVLIPVLAVLIFIYSSQLISLIDWSFWRLNLLFGDVFKDNVISSSTSIRLIHMTKSIHVIFSDAQTFLFGKGIGSYMYEISGVDGRGYPHNILLEIWFELGIIGLFFFLTFALGCFIYKITKSSKTSWVVFLYIILNLLKSNSLVDIRTHLFFFIF
jgi:hypothetical protein